MIEQQVIGFQQQLFEQHNIRTDAHIYEDKGVLFVPEGAPLLPQNVIMHLPYYVFMFGGNVNINVS